MSIAAARSIGKCKLEVSARGCCKCGTEHSFAWATHLKVPVTIDGKQFEIEIPICGHCQGLPEPKCKLQKAVSA